MASNLSRRTALLAAGAAGVGMVGLSPSISLAGNFPKLEKALTEMNEAKTFLEKAESKFGGHKKKAIEALTTAISEIEEAIKFADKKK